MMSIGKLASMLGQYADRRDGELLFFALCDRGIDPIDFDPEQLDEREWQKICEEVEQVRELEDEREQYELRERWFRP